MNRFLASVGLLTAILSTTTSNATHLRCGQIKIDQVGGIGSLTVKVTLSIYTNTLYTNVLVGGDQDYLFFGDGTTILVPEIGPGDPRYTQLDAVSGISQVEFTTTHRYSSYGSYLVSYNEANRNEGIINFSHSVNTPFYLEAMFTLAPDREYFGPDFLSAPFFRNPIGPYAMSLAAKDSNDYSLFYSLMVPKRDKIAEVENYSFPGDVKINAFNGLLTWNGLFNNQEMVGEFLLAGKVSQFDGDELIGYVIRDIQVIVEDAPIQVDLNDNFDSDNNRLYLAQGMSKKIKVWTYSDVPLTTLSVITELADDAYTFETYDSLNLRVGVLTITHIPDIERDNPYVFSVRLTQRGSSYPSFSDDINYTFYTRDIELTVPENPQLPPVEEEIWMSYNPTGFLNINGYPLDNLSFRLSTSQGQAVLIMPEVNESRIDYVNVTPGIYIAQLWQGGKLITVERVLKL